MHFTSVASSYRVYKLQH